MKSQTSVFSASRRKLQFNFLIAHREDPFSVCSFGVLWNEKCSMVIKHSLNETHPQLSLELMDFLLKPWAHLWAQDKPWHSCQHFDLKRRSCRTEVWCAREDQSVLNGTQSWELTEPYRALHSSCRLCFVPEISSACSTTKPKTNKKTTPKWLNQFSTSNTKPQVEKKTNSSKIPLHQTL